MAKKSGIGNLILLGGLAIGGYLLYKRLTGGQQQPQQSGGYSVGWIPGDTTPQTPINKDDNLPPPGTPEVIIDTSIDGGKNITVIPLQTPIQRPKIEYTSIDPITKAINSIVIPAPLGVTPATVAQPVNTGWTAAIYGQRGQPSVPFLSNTLTKSVLPSAPATTKTAVAAIGAGAPPRIVAKIKAGSWY